MINPRKYQLKYKQFVQGIISEDEFKQYLFLSLSKEDLMEIVIAGAKSLRKAVSIGESLGVKC